MLFNTLQQGHEIHFIHGLQNFANLQLESFVVDKQPQESDRIANLSKLRHCIVILSEVLEPKKSEV
jgi:hypothetical protein